MSDYVDSNTIISQINAYTSFFFGGYSIQLPYHMGGKESATTIRSRLTTLCGGDGTSLTQAQIQTIASNNEAQCGIDCSGFALRTANESTNNSDVILDYFSNIARGFDPNFPYSSSKEIRYRYGIGAGTLTNTTYSRQITNITNIKAGDFIRFDSGDHVAVVKQIESGYLQGMLRYIINYSHSSGSKGPHNAYIAFSATSMEALAQKSLTDGTWSDWNSSYSTTIKNLYNYVCRPNCLD